MQQAADSPPATDARSGGAWLSGPFAVIWHSVALLVVLLAPTQHVRGTGLWAVPPAEAVQPLVMGLVYFALAVVLSVRWNPVISAVIGAALFGASLLLRPVFPDVAWSRAILIDSAVIGLVFAFAPFVLSRFRTPVLGLMIAMVAVLVGVGVRSARARARAHPARLVSTALNTVHLSFQGPPQHWTPGDGGGIKAFGDGFLLVTGRGEVFALKWGAKGDSLSPTRLPLTVPLDRAAFIADQTDSLRAWQFRITGLVIDTTVTPARLYVAHQHWDHANKCFIMRVSAADVTASDTGAAGRGTTWATIYDSHPCVPIKPGLDDIETGGRLAWDRSHALLFSIGDLGFDGISGPPISQQMDADYGKVLRLDGKGGATIFALGFRNPQGLIVDREWRVWETEHGPQGGDELNLLVEGKNYGWPSVTYGADYGRTNWPLAPTAHNHGKFEEPALAFVPSVATSDLLEVGDKRFPEWTGDLLIGSLKLRTLYRVRLSGSRVIYTEPIVVGERIRDLAEGSDGRIVMWMDGGDLAVLDRGPAEASGFEVYDRACARCHEATAGGASLGPRLRGGPNRRVANESGYDYSPALKRLGGRWTSERLDAFLKNPNAFAPGTKMAYPGLPDAGERARVIRYLGGR